MDYALFLLVNAVLLVRPGEIVPELASLPIYNAIILLNLLVAAPRIVALVDPGAIRRDPITACVLGLLASIAMSHLARRDFLLAREGGLEFLKIVLYYLLLVAVLDSSTRLRRFLAALVWFVVGLTTLAILQYHGWIDVPSLGAVLDRESDPRTGEEYLIPRLCSAGMFNDPNDLSLILLVAIASCLYLASRPEGGIARRWWLIPAGLFLHALTLTHSRGGFLALLAGMLALLDARFGRKRAVVLAGLSLPLMFVLFAGRQTNITIEEDTGQDRIQLWSSGLIMFRESPAFGVGYGRYADRAGQVAHNSFVHAFAELGLLGGSLFLGAFAQAYRTLHRMGRPDLRARPAELDRLRPFLMAMVVAYASGMLTLSRNYVAPTYMVLGLVAAYSRISAAEDPGLAGPGGPIRSVDLRMVGGLIGAALAFVAATHAFVIAAARW